MIEQVEVVVKFLDVYGGRKAKCKPDPNFPFGQTIDTSGGATVTCKVKLPYPAPNCGLMRVECKKCGNTCALTVAGRVDDPHTFIMACYANQMSGPAR